MFQINNNNMENIDTNIINKNLNYCCNELFIITESEYYNFYNNFQNIYYFLLFLLFLITTLITFCLISIYKHNKEIIRYKLIN